MKAPVKVQIGLLSSPEEVSRFKVKAVLPSPFPSGSHEEANMVLKDELVVANDPVEEVNVLNFISKVRVAMHEHFGHTFQCI